MVMTLSVQLTQAHCKWAHSPRRNPVSMSKCEYLSHGSLNVSAVFQAARNSSRVNTRSRWLRRRLKSFAERFDVGLRGKRSAAGTCGPQAKRHKTFASRNKLLA